MTGSSPRYMLLTPARDEMRYLPDLADSLRKQTLPFMRWVIVDDGSTDGTAEFAEGLAAEDDRITVLRRESRPNRRAGCGDIEAFNAGLTFAGEPLSYDYVGKLDADLVLPDDYFERLFAEFDRNPRLGIAGGHCYERRPGGLVLDRVPDSHVRGATKTYRRECLRDSLPLAEVPGWDTVDEVKARARGWETHSFREPGVIHQRPVTGGSGGVLRGRFVLGRMSYFLGYRPSYFGLRVARNLGKPPYVVGGLAMAWGYVSGAVLRADRYDDVEFRESLREDQRDRMRALLWRQRPAREQTR